MVSMPQIHKISTLIINTLQNRFWFKRGEHESDECGFICEHELSQIIHELIHKLLEITTLLLMNHAVSL